MIIYILASRSAIWVPIATCHVKSKMRHPSIYFYIVYIPKLFGIEILLLILYSLPIWMNYFLNSYLFQRSTKMSLGVTSFGLFFGPFGLNAIAKSSKMWLKIKILASLGGHHLITFQICVLNWSYFVTMMHMSFS